MFKRFSIVVLVAVILVLGVTGAVLAQDSPPAGVCPYGGVCGGYGMGGFGYHGTLPSIMADALGMTLDELYAVLADGQTIAEVAAAQGVGLDDLVATLITPRIEQLEQAVADGYLTQEQAGWMIATMTKQMTRRLENFGLGYGGFGRGGGMGGGFYGGHQRGWRGSRWGSNTTTPRFPSRTTLSTNL